MEEEKMDLLTFLKQTGREDLIDSCFESPEGNFFTPTFDEEGNIVLTGEEVYQKWLESQTNPYDPIPSLQSLEYEDKILKSQLNASVDRQEFIEDCIAEMAMQIYN